MKQNSLKIVCNPDTGMIAYFFKNEYGEWMPLSGSSALSRQEFTNTTLERSAERVLEVADEVYNRKNKGLEIVFEGTDTQFDFINNTAKQSFVGRNIKCRPGMTGIAVLGRRGSGKTCLISGMGRQQGTRYTVRDHGDYICYGDDRNHARWYEIKGIDIGQKNMDKAFSAVTSLAGEDISAVIYCVSANSGRLEEAEKKLIMRIHHEVPEVRIMIALTNCYSADSEKIVDEIKRMTDQITVVPTLAQARSIKRGGNESVIAPFGLDAIFGYIFEGR